MADQRVVVMAGSPYERGRMYGQAQSAQIKRYFQSKCHEFSHLDKEWKRMAAAAHTAMEKHCPIAYAEMQGTASVDPELTLEHLMQLTLFPELEAFDHFHPYRCDICAEVIESASWMRCLPCELDFCSGCAARGHAHPLTEGGTERARRGKGRENGTGAEQPGKKCSSFARAEPNSYLVGQTDEENPPYNQHGLLHVIQRVTDEQGMESLLYAAPGTPCMVGLNSHGLCVLANTLFVPDNRFWDGVPTLAATRELLTKDSLPAAEAYIRGVPLAIPLNFVLAQPGHGVCNLEASHVEVQAIRTPERAGAVYAHCNHCQSASFVSREELPVPPISTQQRQAVLEACIRKAQQAGAPMDLPWLESTLLKPPVNNSFVIATILMEPAAGRLHVRFGVPSVARGGKKRKRRKGPPEPEGAGPCLRDGITDWRQMETAKSLLPAYRTYALQSKVSTVVSGVGDESSTSGESADSAMR
jgi:hypothetical protein